MIRHKVEMSCEVKGNRNIVESMSGECILRLQDRVKIMRVPVVPDEREDEYP